MSIPGIDEHSDPARVANDAPPDVAGDLAEFTDIANAQRFVHEHRAELRYCHERGWLRYGAGRWRHDELRPLACGQSTMCGLAAEAAVSADPKDAMKLVAMLRSKAAVKAAVELARPYLAVRAADLDADPWLFNCANGTLDLRTGRLRPHDPGDLLTKVSPVTYADGARCPVWKAHLEKVVPSAAVRGYLQRLAGYWLTGVIREHVLPVQWGDGGNGKGVTFNTLLHVWGDYGVAVPPELLMQRDGHDEHPTERAQLLGVRLAVASETKQNRHVNEALVKMLTGGDPIAARFMRHDYFTFLPTHKLALLTNYKPVVSGTDRGIWRRLRLVPWTVNIPEAEQDTALEAKLRDEASGILVWAVEGCLAWQRDGLAAPAEVTDATEEFRAASDVLGRFVAECCRLDKLMTAGATQLFQAYERWCRENGEHAAKQKAFGADLARQWPTLERVHGRAGIYYRGIGLLTRDTSDSDSGGVPTNGSHPSQSRSVKDARSNGSQGRDETPQQECGGEGSDDVNRFPVNPYTRTRMNVEPESGSHPSHPSPDAAGDEGPSQGTSPDEKVQRWVNSAAPGRRRVVLS